VSLSAGVLSAGFTHLIDVKQWFFYGAFSFCSTFAVYNGQRLFKTDRNVQTPWMKWVKKNKRILSIEVFLFGAGALYFLVQLNNLSLFAFGILFFASVVSLLYVLKIKSRTLRETPYLKSHLIAFSWMAVVILFPVMNEGKEITILFVALAHYLYTVAATIPFDIRDLKYDHPSQKTIPQVIGVVPAKIVAWALLLGFTALMLHSYPKLSYNYVFYVAVVAQIILVALMNEKRKDFYCAGLIDGAIALVGLSYLVA
jgi:hypothetical protein